jgi:hypothetical protein
MKIYLQTETTAQGDAPQEPRPRQFLMETAASNDHVLAALKEIAQGLGATAAIPPMAHETNLKALLPRDLKRLGILPAVLDDDGSAAVLTIRRSQGEATGPGEVISVVYHAALISRN